IQGGGPSHIGQRRSESNPSFNNAVVFEVHHCQVSAQLPLLTFGRGFVRVPRQSVTAPCNFQRLSRHSVRLPTKRELLHCEDYRRDRRGEEQEIQEVSEPLIEFQFTPSRAPTLNNSQRPHDQRTKRILCGALALIAGLICAFYGTLQVGLGGIVQS